MTPPFPSPTKAWHDNTYDSLSPTRPELSAKGKNVVVTGGGTGIGAETARYFAAAGAHLVVLLGRREQPLVNTKASIENQFPGVQVLVASTDVTIKKEVDAAFEWLLGKEGKVHVLVSNAAIGGPFESVSDVDPEEFTSAISTNLRGSLNVAQAFLRHAASDAVVIDVSSAAALIDLGPVFASYSVAKFAIVRLWDLVGFANRDLRVFHIQPGVVDTDMSRKAGGVKAFGFEDHVTLPASFSVWLASPEARFLKGKFLYANWDVDELKAQAQELEAETRFAVGHVGWPFGHAEWRLNAEFKSQDG